MATSFIKRTTDITYDEALEELRRYQNLYPNVAPEVAAVGLLRQIDSWDEHFAILKALDKVIADQS